MTNAVDAHIGRRVQAIREAAGQSRTELAAAIGLDAATIAAIEAGTQRLRPAAMMRLTAYFGVDVKALFEGFRARRPTPGVDVEPEVGERHLRVQRG